MSKSNKTTRPLVVSKHGSFRYQSGMVTANLLSRGISMEDAVKLSVSLREAVRGRKSIESSELEALLEEMVQEQLGLTSLPPEPYAEQPDLPMVTSPSGTFPFSKGVLVRELVTAGLDVTEAFDLALEIETATLASERKSVSNEEIEQAIERRLKRTGRIDAMRRYKLVGWLRNAKVPVIIFIAGSTGTGKSTVATELAYHLGIHNITSTDIIREAMRTIISSEVVPGLHDHSFKGIALGGEQLSNPRERVLAGFRQQAAQVAVGVRAVIRRALRENVHLIIEGTHLLPPFEGLVPLGTPCHVAGFVLAVNKEERHQARFPQRAKRATLRDPAPYLEAFQSVRWIHDDLLALADDHGTVSFDNKALISTLSGAIDYLSKQLPVEDGEQKQIIPKAAMPAPKRPTLLLILDGLADEPNPLLGGQTPLEAAHTPTIDRLAGGGGQGLIHTGPASGAVPETDDGFKALLGTEQSETAGLGRGLIEALGCGINLPSGAILFRGNLATIQNDGLISDRRAGRIREGATELLSSLKSIPLGSEIYGNIYPGKEHRVIVMLQGPRLSADVCDTDPGGNAAVMTPITAAPTNDTPEADRTATALNRLLTLVGNHLTKHPINTERLQKGLPPANTIITRGAAPVAQIAEQRYEESPFAMVSGCTTSLGLARIYGYLPVTTSKMTGNLDTDIGHKFDTASNLFQDHSLVAIHFKGTDIAAHDRMPLEKRAYIERVDKSLGDFLEKHPDIRIAISADHGTSSKTGHHTDQPVPLLVADWDPENDNRPFNEKTCQQGALGLLGPGELNAILCGEN